MASENSDDGSVVMSGESSYKCDTISPEGLTSPGILINPENTHKPSPRESPREAADFGTYLDKAIAQGSRAFYGTESETSDDEGVGDADLIGKAAHALSEDINDRIRLRIGPCSPTPGKCAPAAHDSVICESATGMEIPVSADNNPSSIAKLNLACNSHPECEERSAQTTSCWKEVQLENLNFPHIAHIATKSSSIESSAVRPAKSEDFYKPSTDADLLKDRERKLEERVRLLKERKYSTRNPSSNRSGSLVEQLKKIDLSLDGGTLKVCDRNLSENALASIVNAVKNNEKLMELDLSGCYIQKGDGIADLVRNASSLRRLLLAWNNLGSARIGIAAFASAVASSPSLEEVDLRSNRIGPATAAALALALRTNNTLKRLDLMWNEIGASGATALVGLLEKNHSLTELRLAGNNIPCQLMAQIDSLLQKNRTGQPMTEDCTETSVHPAVIHRIPNCSEAHSRVPSTALSGSQRALDFNKIIQDELQSIREHLADAKTELDDLQKQKAEVTNQLEASREELIGETKRRDQAERDSEEVKMEIARLRQEMNCLQEKLQANASESSDRIAALESEVMDRKESERATQERESEVSKQNHHLTDQLAMLREDTDKRIQAMEAIYKSEAEYNAGLVQKLECSISQRDQKHLEEVEALGSQLRAEIDSLKSLKDNLMMEVEKHKSNTKLAEQQLLCQEQVLQQEKEAVEQALKRQISMHMVEIECLQHHLEEKDKEHAKIEKRHEECVQSLENELRKERASVTRSELSKSNYEQKFVIMEADMDRLKEKYTAEQERAMLLEEKGRAEELIHNSCIAALSSKHSEEQGKIKGDLLLQRKQIESMNVQLREMQAEHERRMKDIDIQVRGAETSVIEWIQQQFSALQAALSFHATVPAIEYGSLRNSQININRAMAESCGADSEQTHTPRMSQNLAASPLYPRNSRTSPSMADMGPPTSRYSHRSQSTAEMVPPPVSRNPQTIQPIAEMDHTCLKSSLSVASLVQPVQYEEVGTVEEDLVSSGGSIDTDDL